MAFSHEDGRLVIKPVFGPNAGKEIEVQSFSDAEFDPGTQRETVNGRRQAPIYTATKGAKSKLTLTLKSMAEYNRIWIFVHGGSTPIRGNQVTISHVFQRLGTPTQAWRFLRGTLPQPGYKSGDNGVEGPKLEIPIEDAHLNGATIYES